MNSDFLDNLDAAFDDATTSRRDALRKAGRLSGAAALAVTPLFAMAREVMASKPGTTASKRGVSAFRAQNLDALNFALTLEYLEYFFYRRAVGYTFTDEDGNPVPVPPEITFPADAPVALFETIRDHELAHVNLLRSVILEEDGTPDIYQESDFTYEIDGQDIFASDDYELFLTVAQGFEDAGVRAYKGQAPELQDTPFLTTALQIHSVEARHAAAIRRLRGNQGWIPFDQPGAPAAIAPVYGPGVEFPSEANTTQAGVDLVSELPDYTPEQITEAFDEALEMQAIFNIIDPFITGMPNDEDPLTGGAGR